MILCPNCKHKELEGTLFCTECGAQLAEADHLATQAIRRVSTSSLSSPYLTPLTAPLTASQNTAETVISLHFVDTGQIIHLSGQSEFNLGRSADGQPNQPDVDLSPYEAYGQGVSRLHCCLKIVNQRVFITDLGSSNGTRVNGQKITPHVEYPLNHGDVVALGKLKIQFLIRK